MRLLVPLILSVLLSSCATVENAALMDQWRKRSKTELISQWGQPEFSRDYGHGMEVLYYNKSRIYGIEGRGRLYVEADTKMWEFYIGSEGMIRFAR